MRRSALIALLACALASGSFAASGPGARSSPSVADEAAGFPAGLAEAVTTTLGGGQRRFTVVRRAGVLATGSFVQQGGKLTGGGESGSGFFRYTVALAGNGSAAVVGRPNVDANRGAAWIFARSGATWEQVGGRLTCSGLIGDDRVTAVAPPGQPGTVDVTVTGATGTSATSSTTRFTFTSSTTTASTTTTPTTTSTGAAIVARIVYARATGKGKLRRLDLRIRVSRSGTAQLELLLRGATRLQRAVAVRGGANEPKIPLPRGLRKGLYQLKVTLTAPGVPPSTYRTTVPVPA